MLIKKKVFDLLRDRDRLHAKKRRCPVGFRNHQRVSKKLRQVNYQLRQELR